MIIKSTKEGWIKIAKAHYKHESNVQICKCTQGWEVIGGENCGFVYPTMWAAMYAAAKTNAEFVKSNF
jgi:hypothetical protein